ncbi:beta-defensin 107-like [Saccopteryx bilineata]|uniref:beta-defensin 107-like n=1 Tax=Saccopteryx bilineata TaxID=59482 RepID=UPI00338EB758
MPGAMRIFVFTAAALILLAVTFSAQAGVHRQLLCKKMHGRCEASCLTFEDKLVAVKPAALPLKISSSL